MAKYKAAHALNPADPTIRSNVNRLEAYFANAEGLALDRERAAYCEARWKHGITLAQNATVVLDARIDNIVCRLTALPTLDSYKVLWQNGAGAGPVADWPIDGSNVKGG